MKKLLILGGIALSKEIVEQAHKMGILVYVTDYLANSPAKSIADKSFMVSATDVDAVVDLIREEKIDGVLAGYIDLLLPYYVEICNKAKLPCYATKEQIEITSDKAQFKALCKQFGVPTVAEYSYDEVINGKALFPLLVKPVDNSGARGIFICRTLDEFKENYERSMSFSKSKHILIERYMTGKEATIFYFLHDGEIYLTGMGDRHMVRFDEKLIPLPVGYTFPSIEIKDFMNGTDLNIKRMFRSLGMKEGMVFMQCFIEHGKCIIYEMGYRLTGSIEHHLFQQSNGFNTLQAMIDFAVGNLIDNSSLSGISPQKACTANVTLLMNAGEILEYRGLDEVTNIDGVLHVFPSYSKGTILYEDSLGTLAQVVVRVLLTADEKSTLISKMERIKDTIEVIDIDGKDLLIEGYSYFELVK